jgi:hypothetical protein
MHRCQLWSYKNYVSIFNAVIVTQVLTRQRQQQGLRFHWSRKQILL